MSKVKDDHESRDSESRMLEGGVDDEKGHNLYETNPAPNMWSAKFFGVYASYLCVGFIYGSGLALIYPVVVVLNQESNNKQLGIQSMFTLFWSFKIFFGMLSDTVPIRGQRRKPYLLIGWGIAISCSVALAITASLSGTLQVCYSDVGARVNCESSDVADGPYSSSSLSVNVMVLFMAANNFGYVMADVAMDSLSIEYAKREHPEKRGEIQGMCYTIRALGFLGAYLITGFGFNGEVFKGDFSFSLSIPAFLWILVGLQCIGLPWFLMLHDEVVTEDDKLESEASFGAMWDLLCNKTMAQLMLFNIVMNACQSVSINARNSVLNIWVGMDNLVNAADQDISQLIQILTLFAASRWLKAYNWRLLLVGGTTFWTVWQMVFWLVAFDVDRHPWFVVLIDMDQTFAQSIGYLVMMWAVVEMAPKGLEGTTLALCTTVGNAGQSIGGYIVVAYNSVFALNQVQLEQDSDATRRQYFYNSLAVIATQWVYILFMFWLPTSFPAAKSWFQKQVGTKSKGWAVAAVFFVCLAVVWGTTSTFMTFACPCNKIFGGDGCQPHFFSCRTTPIDHSRDGNLTMKRMALLDIHQRRPI